MADRDSSYSAHVRGIEHSLGDFAFKSKDLEFFIDGTDAIKAFEEEWQTAEGKARLSGRTPFALERDRIMYSDEFRAQSDKYHSMFFGRSRATRNYATHSLRAAQIARSICGRLRLNSDLAEAVALGMKVGSIPFIHMSKRVASDWAKSKIAGIDSGQNTNKRRSAVDQSIDQLAFGDYPVPSWLGELTDSDVIRQINKYVPYATGPGTPEFYTSGQESYWRLAVDPFLLQAKRPYSTQTAYGIWRHSIQDNRVASQFKHRVSLTSAGKEVNLAIGDEHYTNEAAVVRYADDISWVIENLHEAAKVRNVANSPKQVFHEAATALATNDMPAPLHIALTPQADVSKIYTYFIDDLVTETSSRMSEAGKADRGSETRPLVSLSETGIRMLEALKAFLHKNVFSEDRMRSRNETLRIISSAALDLMYEKQGNFLNQIVEDRSRMLSWAPEQLELAHQHLSDPIHRIQACIDAFVEMSDMDVYSLLGLDLG